MMKHDGDIKMLHKSSRKFSPIFIIDIFDPHPREPLLAIRHRQWILFTPSLLYDSDPLHRNSPGDFFVDFRARKIVLLDYLFSVVFRMILVASATVEQHENETKPRVNLLNDK